MNITNKITSVLLTATTAVWLSGFAMFVPVANAQSVTDLQSQINALLSQISALQAQLASGSSSSAGNVKCTFTRDLTVGSTGADVKCLQQYLNDGGNSSVSLSGAGSKGLETMTFGPRTMAAVAKWQAANGLSPAAGFFGPKSRAKYAAMVAGTPTPSPVPGPTPSGSGLTVTLAADQPAAGLFGESFASRPFTKLNLTASADGDVTVKALTVERTGQGSDAAFSGVVALDENGIRVGSAKTFGSDHRLRLNDPIVVKAGQTRTITLAGDSDSDQDAYNGQLVALSLVGVETNGANVNAVFPLTGNTMTVNSTLAIGGMTLARGAFDPGSGQTKEIGTTGYVFSGLRLTATNNEDVLVKSIRWNQSGSAALTDLANVKVVFDGTSYDATPSSDGKYYVAMFGSGVKIEKGLSKEMYVKGDIAGGSARTADFDLYRYADLQVQGLTYGYNLLPSATEVAASADDGNFHSANPNFDAFEVFIGAGTLNAQNAPTVGAQNVAISLPNQPLGGLIIDTKGEDVTVAAMNFDLSAVKSANGRSLDTDDVTNITLVDDSGAVVAGPVDGVAGGNNAIRFTDTVTFHPGRKVYTLKGKLGTDFQSNDTLLASTTPGSDWTTVRGVVSGVSITPTPSSAITMSTMTVKAASLSLSLTPETQANGSSTAQTVVAGTSNYKFADYVLDASGSGEDIRVNTMQLRNTFSSSNTADDLTNCQIYDGATPLNTGSNIVNPSNSDTSPANKTFSFDTSLIIPKGTVKILSVKCNLVSGANGSGQWQWGITDQDASLVATGVTSGQTVDGSDSIVGTDAGRIVSAATSGTVTFTLDSASPSAKWVQAGSTDNTMAVFRFNATNEDIRLDTIGLQLGTSSNAADAFASNSPSDVTQVTIWDGMTKVGSAIFSSNDYATATLTGVIVPKNGQKLLTVKADIGSIYTSSAAHPGHLALVNYDASNSSNCAGGATSCQRGAIGVGMSSGVAVGTAGSDSSTNGARIAASIPTVTKGTLTSNIFSQTASAKSLYRFSVSAPANGNGISLYKFVFNIATSSNNVSELPGIVGGNAPSFVNDFGVTNLVVKCYSDAYTTGSCGNTNGVLNQYGFAVANGNGSDQDFGSTTSDMTTAPLSGSNGASSGDGLVVDGSPAVDVPFHFNPTASSGATAEGIFIPAGQTRYFELVGDIANATTTSSITVKMNGDATFSAGTISDNGTTGATAKNVSNADDWTSRNYGFATTAWATDSWQDNEFIWSGDSTTTGQSIYAYDWFNGFLVPGLSNTDTGAAETLSKN